MKLNDFGKVAYNEWRKLPERFLNVELDVFQIMPNHLHGIIVLKPANTTVLVAEVGLGMVVWGQGQARPMQCMRPLVILPTRNLVWVKPTSKE